MLHYIKQVFPLFLVLLFNSCIQPYEPEVIQMNHNYLVVDGFLNTGPGPTMIKLTRTQNLDATTAPGPETRATITIEEEGGQRHPLTEVSSGTYVIQNMPVNPAKRYRLHIKTAGNNRSYNSDFVPVQLTPPIDELTWAVESDGLQLQLSTHDPHNNTRYYRWDFEETWEFTAPERAIVEVVGDEIVTRTAASENIHHCWRTEPSTNVMLASTVQYTRDELNKFPLYKLPPSSEKLRYGYSILVKQYAQTKEAYAYWDILRKNTEQIGGLFDPLPSQLLGNIRTVGNTDEPVVGYFSAYSVQEKRVFISRQELPQQWTYPIIWCQGDSSTASLERAVSVMKNNDPYWSVKRRVMGEGNVLQGYLLKYKGCVDCRLYGTNIKPDFWQQ